MIIRDEDKVLMDYVHNRYTEVRELFTIMIYIYSNSRVTTINLRDEWIVTQIEGGYPFHIEDSYETPDYVRDMITNKENWTLLYELLKADYYAGKIQEKTVCE